MNSNQIAIENGKQIGLSSSILRNNETYWATVAIQKNNGEYIVHIDLISERNMAAEKYEEYETRAFSSLQAATDFLLKMSPISIGDISELKPFKGQKGFNVEAEEVIGLPPIDSGWADFIKPNIEDCFDAYVRQTMKLFTHTNIRFR